MTTTNVKITVYFSNSIAIDIMTKHKKIEIAKFVFKHSTLMFYQKKVLDEEEKISIAATQ